MKSIKYYEDLGLMDECGILQENEGFVNEIQQMIDDGKTEFKSYDYPIYTWTGTTWGKNRQVIHLVAEANGYFTTTIIVSNQRRGRYRCSDCGRSRRKCSYCKRMFVSGIERKDKVIKIGKDPNFDMSIQNRVHKNKVYHDRKKRTTIKNKMHIKLGPPIPKQYGGRGYSDSKILWCLRFDSKYYFKHIPKDICTVIGSYLN